MEEMLNKMIDAGLEVKFCSRSHVQVFPKGSNAWFWGDDLKQVFDKAIKYDHLKS